MSFCWPRFTPPQSTKKDDQRRAVLPAVDAISWPHALEPQFDDPVTDVIPVSQGAQAQAPYALIDLRSGRVIPERVKPLPERAPSIFGEIVFDLPRLSFHLPSCRAGAPRRECSLWTTLFRLPVRSVRFKGKTYLVASLVPA